MKIVADLHVHTVASGHAYSTVQEIARAAADRGLQMVAITDHGPAMPGSPHRYHFSNMRILPREIYGVEVLRGIEANILDVEGNIDLPDHYQKYMDIVLAGFHKDCFEPGSVEDNTRAMVNAITGGKVDVIVHPGNPAFKIQPEPVVRAAIEHNVLLEINNASLGLVRQGSRENCLELSKLTARLGGRVILGSDAHYAGLVGDLAAAAALAAEAGLTPRQVLNTSRDSIWEFLRQRGRKAYTHPAPRV
ncbi:MAG: phosphatase [Firmicutes bacterium]|nr:phosphatase [Bacillota bacterium]